MRHKRQHKPLCIIINSFLYYYYRKVEIISNYKCTFGLLECKSTSVTQKSMPNQREQYRDTVHLFIGTGLSLCKFTFMSFIFTIYFQTTQWGLNSLFPFKSVPFSSIVPKLPCAQLWSNNNLRHDHAFHIVYAFNPSLKVPVHMSHLEDIVKLRF